jgi:hypothetical protein
MSVTFSGDEFDFMYDAFEVLTSPVSTTEEIVEATKLENKIWVLLKGKAASFERLPSASSDRPAGSSPAASP